MESGKIIPNPQTSKTFRSADHSDYMLKRLEKFYLNKEYCDVTLIAASDNTRVEAHRGALAVASEFFLKMFSTEFKESKSKEIQLKDVNGVVLRLIIGFVYTASIELSTELVHEIAKAAHLYQINSLVEACYDFMEEHLTPGNCIYFYAMAEQYGWTRLQSKAIVVISKNFSSVTVDTKFLQLNQDQLCKLIDSDELNVQSEEEVFNSIVQWIKYDEVSRAESMLPLLENVRFSELSMKFISDNRGLVCKTDECNELVWNWMEWHLSPEKRSEIEGLNTKSRKSCHMQTLIALSWDGNILYTFDRHSSSWPQKDLPQSVQNLVSEGFASTITNNKLILTRDGKSIFLDLRTCELTNLPPMNRERYYHSSVFLNGALYVLGGRDGANWLDCIETYDFSNRTWQIIGNMPFQERTEIAVLNNEIYIIGSQNMFSYNTTTGVMSPKPPKGLDSNNFVLCAVNGYLYAVGYFHDETIERYDPTAESWSNIKSSSVKTDYIKCISYNNRLCVLGYNSDSIIISAEEYYPKTDEWKTSAIVPLSDRIRIISVVEPE